MSAALKEKHDNFKFAGFVYSPDDPPPEVLEAKRRAESQNPETKKQSSENADTAVFDGKVS